ncbi:MAG: hypothetical protein HYU28_12790, partial [Actinobacteria bacterium]|nr:hypothetical protein [Actinomycetota bacterium]
MGHHGAVIRRFLPALVVLTVLAASCAGDGDDAGRPTTEADQQPSAEPADLPTPRTEVAGAAWQGAIVVLGGLNADGSPSVLAHVFDPDGNDWAPLPDLPVALHHTAVVVLEGRVWVIGGYTGDLSTSSASARVF